MFRTWWRQLVMLRSRSSGRSKRRRFPRRPSGWPRLEFLETRLAPATLTPIPTTISPTEAQAFSGNVGSFTDSDGNTDPTKYTALIDWGDGSLTSAGTIAFNSSLMQFDVTGSHTYNEDGSDPVNVTIH